MSETIFRKVMCSDRLPMRVAESYLTDIGNATFWGDNAWSGLSQDSPIWWLEEVEINTIKAEAWQEGLEDAANYSDALGMWELNGYLESKPELPTNPYLS
jgi:hypothetical protein